MKKSRILAEMHETARGLYRARTIDKRTMRDFDAWCVPAARNRSAALRTIVAP